MKPIGGLAKSSFSRLGPRTDWQRESLGGRRSDWLRSVQTPLRHQRRWRGASRVRHPNFLFSVLTKVGETGPSNP